MDLLRKDFSHNPTSIEIERSKFSRNSGLKTTLNAGQLIPIYIDEVLPGDTFKVDNSYLCRMLTPIFPVMDNAYLDFFWFFVPNRIVWDHWKEFCGENTSGPWTQEVQYQVPQLKFDNQALFYYEEYGAGYSLSNYLGVPAYLESGELTVSDLPNRAYRLIWNEFFRSENLQSPIPVYTDDTDRSFGYDGKYGLEILPVCKRHDLFTSALPQPQKGDSVFIPVLDSAPVSGIDNAIHVLDDNDVEYRMYYDSTGGVLTVTKDSAPYSPEFNTNIRLADETLISNLTQASSVSINELRQAFQIQRLLEKDARGGTRYRELLLSHFGVISPDSRVQVPEYLGGFSNPINMDQVLQTSASDQVSPQGNTAAYSLTSGSESGFTKSFTEHGMIMGLCCIRVEHTYSQGVPRYLFRKNRFDFYYPSLAHLGEQAILKREIMATGDKSLDEEPFGYQEAWYDYRYKPNTMTGMFKPNRISTDESGFEYVESPLAKAWTFADFYTSRPSLGSQFIVEDQENVNKVIAVPTNRFPDDQPVYNNNHQFLLDVYFDVECVRPMPLYSIPGLIDHY